MEQKEQMRKNLIEEINSYYDHYVYMVDVMAVHNHMQSYINQNSQVLEIAPNFFKIVYAATIDSYMLTFARLYDNSEQTKSMRNLIDKCKKNVSLWFLRDFTKEVLIYLLEALGENPIKETIYDNDLENLLVKYSKNVQ